MAHFRLFLVLLSILFSTLAVDIRGNVHWNDVCTSYSELGSTKVVLNDGKLSGGVIQDGSFVIPDVQPGSYLISVQAHDHTFDSLRIDVPSDSSDSIPSVHPYTLGTPFSPPSPISLSYPIIFTPRAKNSYFVAREGFNLVGMFSNPMMLIMVFTGVMMFAMPYIMKNMDPEMLEDMKNRQSKMVDLQSAMQSGDIKSGLSALMGDDEPKMSGTRAQPASSSQVKNRGGKNKKR